MTTAFMGKTIDEWVEMEDFYHDYADIISTPEGQLLAAKGKLRLEQESLDASLEKIDQLQAQIKELEETLEKST